MTLPVITQECFLAAVEKAAQQDPTEFATQFMFELMADQPTVGSGVMALLGPFTTATRLEGMRGEDVAEVCMTATWCVLGVVLRAMKAQAEAAEMNEVWK